MDRQTKIQLLAALEERKLRQRAAPLAYFEPHARQQEFFDLCRDHRITIFSGANRSGKTVGNAVWTICHAYGYWIHKAFADGAITLTDDGDYPPRHEVPPKYWIRRVDGVPLREERRILVVTGLTLLKGIGNILFPEIENWLPYAMRGRYKVSRGPMSVPISLEHPEQGWRIDFGSSEQAPMTFEGVKNDAVSFDEPPTRTIYTACWRGCTDYRSSVIMTFTPLGSHAPWIYEEFFVNPRDDTAIVKVTQKENPHLTAEAIDEFESGIQFSEEELLARTRGEFGFLTHRAFQGYDRAVHLIDPFPIPKSWPRLCVCDPASRRPFYFLWLAWDLRRETIIAYREFPFDRLHHSYRNSEWAIRDYATIIRNLEGEERVDGRVIDPRFGPAEYSIKGEKMTSVCDDFAKLGLYFDARVPDTGREETGIQRIRDALWYDTRQAIGDFNRPKLLVFNTCKSLDHSLQNYSFVPPDARDERILKEKTSEAFKDPIDALRYGLLYGRPVSAKDRVEGYIPQSDFEEENAIDSSWL